MEPRDVVAVCLMSAGLATAACDANSSDQAPLPPSEAPAAQPADPHEAPAADASTPAAPAMPTDSDSNPVTGEGPAPGGADGTPSPPDTTEPTPPTAPVAMPQAGESLDLGDDGTPRKFRVLILADTHIIGPQYDGNEDAIYTTEDNARQVALTVNGIAPQPDFGVLLGDVFHDGFHGEPTVDWYKNNTSAVSIAAQVLDTFDTPVYPVWGNHDYTFDNDRYPHSFAHELFAEFFDRAAYYAIDYGGWKFILANGNLGSKGQGSYGAEQLAWIDAQLAEGKPSMLFTHYMLMDNIIQTVTHHDESDGPIRDLYQLVDRYKNDNLKSIFVGHTHNFWDVTALTGVGAGAPSSFKHYVVGATRYGVNNFWIVEFDGRSGTYDILDVDKAEPGALPKQRGSACDYSQPPPFPCD